MKKAYKSPSTDHKTPTNLGPMLTGNNSINDLNYGHDFTHRAEYEQKISTLSNALIEIYQQLKTGTVDEVIISIIFLKL